MLDKAIYLKKNQTAIPVRAMAILEVKDLSAGYETGFAIRDISFSLEKGSFVSILGKNGSGKSTLIKALIGLLRKTSGEARVEGENVHELSPRQVARKIAYVPQIFDFSFEFSVLEVIQMGRYACQGRLRSATSEDERIIKEVLAATETAHLKDQKIAHLSGGERQRVFIARAVAQDAPLLFLDEPSSHLDISYQADVYHLLRRLQGEKGKTVLCTEHNINLAIPYSQRIIFLKEGKIQNQGRPQDLITKESIKNVFGADVDVRENPHTGLPEISLIPKSMTKK